MGNSEPCGTGILDEVQLHRIMAVSRLKNVFFINIP